MLSKDTHGTVVRITPPLNIEDSALDWAIGEIGKVLREVQKNPRPVNMPPVRRNTAGP